MRSPVAQDWVAIATFEMMINAAEFGQTALVVHSPSD
jgi:hypothetical protein